MAGSVAVLPAQASDMLAQAHSFEHAVMLQYWAQWLQVPYEYGHQ